MPARPAGLDPELFEDRLRERIASVRLPLPAQPRVQHLEAFVGLEDAADDELRRDSAVPLVLLEPKRDVVPPHAPQPVQLRPLAERDRAARIDPVTAYAEPQMLALPHRRKLRDLAGGREQRHLRIAEAERRETAQLTAEPERQLRTARQDGVDDGRRHEVFLLE